MVNSRLQLWNYSFVYLGFGEDMGIECFEC